MRRSPTLLAYLPIVADFIPVRLTFMRSNKHLQLVFIKNLGGNVWSKVAASSSVRVWVAASFASGITPKDIDNLGTTNQIRLPLTSENLSFYSSTVFPETLTQVITKSTISHHFLTLSLFQNCFIFISSMNLLQNNFNATTIPFYSPPVTNTAIFSNHEESAFGLF